MAIPPTASLILPRQLPAASAVTATDMIVGDNGSVVQRVTPTQLVNAATPLASQSEAEAGTNNNNRMTPLRVAQAISFQAVASATLAADTGATLVGATGGITVQAELDGLKQADIDLQDGVDGAQADASAAISTANAASSAVSSVSGIANAALSAASDALDGIEDLSDDLASLNGAEMVGVDDGATLQQAIAVAADPVALIASTSDLPVGATVRTADGFIYKVAPSNASNAHLTTAGGAKLYVIPDTDGLYNVEAFGATPGSSIDNTPIIQKAIDVGPAKIPAGAWPGYWRCDSMIEIKLNQSLTLETGVRLTRYAANSSSTDPVIWLRGSNARLQGAGPRFSSVVSQNRSPKGVVRVGHEDMEHSHALVTFCEVRGLEIIGAQVGGQTTGDPDICLFVPNPQLGGLASYFHTFANLIFTQANWGLNLRGWANGNIISNIHGRQLGNTTLGDGGLLWMQGALDNVIHGLQFHAASNQIGVKLEDYDNTAVSGGFVHQCQYNSITGVVCEQGGSSALGLKALASRGNYIQMIANASGGNQITSDWNALDNILVDPTRDFAGVRTGYGHIKTFSGIGDVVARVTFNQSVNGTFNTYGLMIVRFSGGQTNGVGYANAEYRVPITGLSAYNIATPVKNWGDTITISQTDNGTNFVEVTISGASSTVRSSVTIEVQGFSGAVVD